MSSGCGDVLALADFQTAKKHQIFEAEVITGKQGGVASGLDIDYATNQVTGQTQKTLPAVLRDAGFSPASFNFTTGGTLGPNDADVAVLWPLPDGGDGQYYVWRGSLPKVIPASSTPASTGGVSASAWQPLGDISLRTDLADTSPTKGSALVAYSPDETVQDAISSLSNRVKGIPSRFKSLYEEDLLGNNYAQGMDETENYWFICYVDASVSPIVSRVKRIKKSDMTTVTYGPINNTAIHNLIILNDDEILHPSPVPGNDGYQYVSSLTKYNFATTATSTIPFPSINSAYAMCWDGEDIIYQLDLFNQAVSSGDIGDGRFDQIRSYSLSAASFLGCIPMPREIVREGFVQDMHWHKGYFYFITGASFNGTETSNTRVTSMYKVSDAGILLEGKNFRADSFASEIGFHGAPAVIYEAQGISVLNGKLSALIYTGVSGVGAAFHIITEAVRSDPSSVEIRQGIGASSYRRKFFYTTFSDLNVSNATLASSGDAVGYLSRRMLDNSELSCALDSTGYPAITSQLGIPAGSIFIRRDNANRIFGEVTTSGGAGAVSYIYRFSVFSGSTTPLMRVSVQNDSSGVVYQGSVAATVGNTFSVAWNTFSSVSIFVSNVSSANPCGVLTLTSSQAKHCYNNGRSLVVSNGPASLSILPTATGFNVVGVSGSPVVALILSN